MNTYFISFSYIPDTDDPEEAFDEVESEERYKDEIPDETDNNDDEYFEEYDESEYIQLAKLKMYKIEPDENGILQENEEKLVFQADGKVIFGDIMFDCGEDPHYFCDAKSGELEYVWSALTDKRMGNAPLVNAVNNEYGCNILYLEDYSFEEDVTEDEKIEILDIVSGFCDQDEINVVAFYPSPLPYDNTKEQQLTNIACAINSTIRGSMIEKCLNPSDTPENEISMQIAPELYLRAAGMRVSGVSYPETAKNREEWDLFEKAGWQECGNSRLLFAASE